MARTLPIGRLTKEDPGEAIRKAGFIGAFGNKGVFGNYMDQFFFESFGIEHILGTAAQVAADYATMTWSFSNTRFEDKAGAEVVLEDYDRIAVIGMNTLTADIVIDNVSHLDMFHIGNTAAGADPSFLMGDSGGGVPYKIRLGSNTENCWLTLQTDATFQNLLRLNLTQVQRQFIANQGKNNHISVNGEVIYNPSEAGQIITLDTPPINPYLLRMNGATWPWSADAAVNSLAWFRDLNIKLDGWRLSSGSIVEQATRFTTAAILSGSPYLFQVNIANRFFTDISSLDTNIHSRTDPTGVSIAKTANFNGTNVVTFTTGLRAANGMRIQGGAVPGGGAATTILRNSDASGTAEMYDALTGAAVIVASATGVSVTLDNSGAAGGSLDDDYFQGHLQNIETQTGTDAVWVSGVQGTGAVKNGGSGAFPAASTSTNPSMITKNYITDGSFGSPRVHDQTQPRSTGIFYYYRA